MKELTRDMRIANLTAFGAGNRAFNAMTGEWRLLVGEYGKDLTQLPETGQAESPPQRTLDF